MAYNLDELDRNYRARYGNSSTKSNKKGGVRGFLTSLIGEAGGTGGALAGAGTGAAIGSVVPGIGTAIGGLVGAGLGGFLGGTGGQLIENKVRDNKLDINKALKHGAVEGVMGAGPLKLLKGFGGATKAVAGGADEIADVSRGAVEAIQTPLLSKIPGAKKVGTSMAGSSAGIKPGKEIGAIENVDSTVRTLSELGIKGTPKTQARLIKTAMGDLSKQVDDILDATPIPIQGSAVTKRLADAFLDPTDARFIDINLENPAVKKLIEQYGVKLQGITDAKSLNQFVKTINKTASQAEEKLRNPTARALSAKEEALLSIKRATDDVLSEIEEIKPLKQKMAVLFDANPDIVAASQKGMGAPFVSGFNFKTPVQAAKGATSRVAANLQGTPQPVVTPQGIAGRTLSTSAAGAAIGSMEQGEEEPTDEELMAIEEANLLEQQQQQEDNSPFSQANVEANVQAILEQGGDFKDVKEYLGLVEQMQAYKGGGAGKLSAEASKTLANANSGLRALSDIRAIIANDPSVVSKSSIPGQATPVGGFISSVLGTGEYNAAISNAKDIISRIRSGAALTAQEEIRYKSLIPKPGDDAGVIDYKLGQLEDLFTSVSNRTGNTTTNDLLGL